MDWSLLCERRTGANRSHPLLQIISIQLSLPSQIFTPCDSRHKSSVFVTIVMIPDPGPPLSSISPLVTLRIEARLDISPVIRIVIVRAVNLWESNKTRPQMTN